jgi:hypothetical protein
MESDAIENPRLDCLEKLAAALAVPMQWLALGIGPEPVWDKLPPKPVATESDEHPAATEAPTGTDDEGV